MNSNRASFLARPILITLLSLSSGYWLLLNQYIIIILSLSLFYFFPSMIWNSIFQIYKNNHLSNILNVSSFNMTYKYLPKSSLFLLEYMTKSFTYSFVLYFTTNFIIIFDSQFSKLYILKHISCSCWIVQQLKVQLNHRWILQKFSFRLFKIV